MSSPQKEVEVAIKTLNSNASDKDRLRFIQEAAIMCQFDHENVIKLYGVVTDAPRMIVLEYMSRGDLRNLLLKLQSSLVSFCYYNKLYFCLIQQRLSSTAANCFVKVLSRNCSRHGVPQWQGFHPQRFGSKKHLSIRKSHMQSNVMITFMNHRGCKNIN